MKRLLRYLPYLPWTVWFNFRYLPLRQAVRLPILLRKPRLLRCGGRILSLIHISEPTRRP